MAKNEKFDDTITIRITGTSTNRFVPEMIEKMFTDYVNAINVMYQQTDASIEITQDYKPKKRKGIFNRG